MLLYSWFCIHIMKVALRWIYHEIYTYTINSTTLLMQGLEGDSQAVLWLLRTCRSFDAAWGPTFLWLLVSGGYFLLQEEVLTPHVVLLWSTSRCSHTQRLLGGGGRERERWESRKPKRETQGIGAVVQLLPVLCIQFFSPAQKTESCSWQTRLLHRRTRAEGGDLWVQRGTWSKLTPAVVKILLVIMWACGTYWLWSAFHVLQDTLALCTSYNYSTQEVHWHLGIAWSRDGVQCHWDVLAPYLTHHWDYYY